MEELTRVAATFACLSCERTLKIAQPMEIEWPSCLCCKRQMRLIGSSARNLRLLARQLQAA